MEKSKESVSQGAERIFNT
nr:hypothetical protein [Rickettsia asembonensis]